MRCILLASLLYKEGNWESERLINVLQDTQLVSAGLEPRQPASSLQAVTTRLPASTQPAWLSELVPFLA